MKKNLTRILLVSALAFFAMPNAKAVLTDPDDYVAWDSGILADSATAVNFEWPPFITISENVVIKEIGGIGRHIKETTPDKYVLLGFPYGSTNAQLAAKKIWGIWLPKADTYVFADGTSCPSGGNNGGVAYADFRKLSPAAKAMNWRYNGPENIYSLPTDSIVLRVPKDCDSIYIEYGGTGEGYGIWVYEKACGPDSGYYAGGNNGNIWKIGFKPRHHAAGDSTEIVIMSAHKDYFSHDKEWSSSTLKDVQVNMADFWASSGSYAGKKAFKGERWGKFASGSINRIKVYGKVKADVLPPFTGLHSGWTFKYTPTESGTVDVDKPLKEANGWVSNTYRKYAADDEASVVRSVLTACKSLQLGYDNSFKTFAARITGLGVTSDTTDFAVDNQHVNYFEINAKTTKFQDLKLSFDFAVRNAAVDSIVVVAKPITSSSWIVVGKYANSANPNQSLAKVVDCELPAEIANQSTAVIRLLLNGGDYNEGAEFDLTNLKITGFDDYYVSNEDAVSVAYITTAADRLHVLSRSTTADSSDVIMKKLLEDEKFNVTPITKDVWSLMDSEEKVLAAFADYDVVLMSEFIDAESSIAKLAKCLVGKKPFLNFDAAAHAQWTDGYTFAEQANDTSLVIGKEFVLHPIFNGLNVCDTNVVTPNLFDTMVGEVALQGFKATTDPVGVLATGVASNNIALFEDNTISSAKYMLLPLAAQRYAGTNSKFYTLTTNIISYLAGNGKFVEPSFNLVATGAVVDNVADFKAALAYDYSPLNLSEIVIEVKNCTDEGGIYALGNAGLVYGKGKIVVKPYGTDAPVFSGSFKATQTMQLSDLTLKGLTFKNVEGCFLGFTGLKNRLSGTLLVENNTFIGLNGSFFQATSADSSYVNTVVAKNNTFDQVSGAAFFQFDQAPMALDSIFFSENVLTNYTAKQFLQMASSGYTGSADTVGYTIVHNTFANKAEATSSDFITLSTDLKTSFRLNVTNNIIDKVFGASKIDLFTPSVDTLGYKVNLQHNLFEGASFETASLTEPWQVLRVDLNKADLGIETIFTENEGTQISKLSPLFVAGTNRDYVGAFASYADRVSSMTLTVKNVDELKTALDIAVPGDIIELQNYQKDGDTIDVYLLGNSGFNYPTLGGTLVIRAAEGHQPKLFGRISPKNNAKLTSLTYENLAWVDSSKFAGYATETYAPFYLSTATTLSIDYLHFNNCSFSDFENQCIMRLNKCAGLYMGEIRYTNNIFENMGGSKVSGEVGAHLFQFDKTANYTVNKFIFRHNVVNNFHGSQVFNIPRAGVAEGADSTIVIDLSNNLFRNFGGNAKDSKRNFLEFTAAPVGCDVNIAINNNIFSNRWSAEHYPICQLALYDTADVKSSYIEVMNNFFEGEYYSDPNGDVFGPNPVSPSEDEDAIASNLIQSAGNAQVNNGHRLTYEDNYVFEVFESDELVIDQESPLYTGGKEFQLNGETYSFIGPMMCYGIVDALEREAFAREGLMIFTANGRLFIESKEQTQMTIFSLEGRRVMSRQLEAGMNVVEGLHAHSLYLVRVNGMSAKVMIR